jgi:type IV secretion system protein VirD4
MHKVKYYSDRKLKRIFNGQKGDLPEPDPIPLTAATPFQIAVKTEPAQPAPEEAKPEDVADEEPEFDPADSDPENNEAESYDGFDFDDVDQVDEFDEEWDRDDDDNIVDRTAAELERLQALDLDRVARDQAARQKALTEVSQQSNSAPAAGGASALEAQRELLQRIKAVQERNRANRSIVD